VLSAVLASNPPVKASPLPEVVLKWIANGHRRIDLPLCDLIAAIELDGKTAKRSTALPPVLLARRELQSLHKTRDIR
jgi:hypothetical protein